ncbi:MAG: ABC transporter ATP-binding protein [Acidobacteria bacterium]|nr:ABC transporter ATP-binding protein [Acidobacteriota bacterium]MBI3281596.1 ABC transporter ATP-binding protein [Acidobacteriota bacterium]
MYSRSADRKLLRSHVEGWFGRKLRDPFYALRGVSFTLDHCQSVAVLGANGAGKSTLLSLVAGLSEPDEGTVRVNGRVAALLELGSGFHPDLTGIENVKLNASLLGLSRRRTEELLPHIVDFSGIAEFIHQPLRTYSSGMIMRLGFSVAVNVDPDILILDEVFAVGDQAFQARCHEKIIEFKKAGKTMLCVSHASATLHQLCDRALWLDHGQLVMDGPVDDVIAIYEGRVPR